jgi:Short C-terminal domain
LERLVPDDEKGRELLAERQRIKNAVSVWPFIYDGAETIEICRGVRKGVTHRIDEHVEAVVEAGGNLRSHPTVTRTAVGALLTGTPIGAAFWKKEGSLFLLVSGRDWADMVELKPKEARDAQLFAQRVNLVAKMAREASGAGDPPPAATDSDAIGQLERLAKLRDSGALTDEEFTAEKQRISITERGGETMGRPSP